MEKRLPWHPRESSGLSQSPLHKYFQVAQLFPCLCCRICTGKHSAVGYWSVLGWVTSVVLSTWGPSGELRPKGRDCCDCMVGPSPGPAFLKLPSTAPCKTGSAASFQCFIQKARLPGGHLTRSSKKHCYFPQPETVSGRRSSCFSFEKSYLEITEDQTLK